MQFLIEEAAGSALELHEAELQRDAEEHAANAGASDVRARHEQLVRETMEGAV